MAFMRLLFDVRTKSSFHALAISHSWHAVLLKNLRRSASHLLTQFRVQVTAKYKPYHPNSTNSNSTTRISTAQRRPSLGFVVCTMEGTLFRPDLLYGKRHL